VLFLISIPFWASAAELSGQQIYQRDCIACHGADGAAQTALGKQIKPHPARDLRPKILSRQHLRQIIAQGIGKTGMHGHGKRLNKAAIERIIAYIFQFDYQTKPNHGNQVFEKYCARCHGLDARGMAIFKTPDLILSEYSDIEMARIMRDGHSGTIMGGFKYEIDNDAIADVIAWLRLLRYGLEFGLKPQHPNEQHTGNNQ